jgi:hypothetical protein
MAPKPISIKLKEAIRANNLRPMGFLVGAPVPIDRARVLLAMIASLIGVNLCSTI